MALIINGEEVDPALIDEEFSLIKSHYESLAQVSCCERDPEFIGYAKENITRRILIAQKAEEEAAPVLKKEVDEALEKLFDEHGGREAFAQRTGLSDEGEKMLRRDLGARIRLEKFVDEVCGPNPEPTEKEIEDYYQEHLDEFRTEEEVRASHIFKSLRKAENKQELYETMREIRKEAVSGKDFHELAKEHSDKPEEEIDLGFFKRGDHMDEFETIAFSMEKDEVSPVFGTHWGFHLAKVTDRRPAEPRPLEELKESIVSLIIDDHRKSKLENFAEELKKTAEIVDEDDGDRDDSGHYHDHGSEEEEEKVG